MSDSENESYTSDHNENIEKPIGFKFDEQETEIEIIKKPIKPKRVMSEKQLENLKKGRETSLANRKKKRDMRLQEKKVKEEDAELVRKYKAKERERLKKEVETPLEDRVIAKPQIIEKPVVVEKGYSQEQLDDAVSRAVEQSVSRVEILSKQRKEIKKKGIGVFSFCLLSWFKQLKPKANPNSKNPNI